MQLISYILSYVGNNLLFKYMKKFLN